MSVSVHFEKNFFLVLAGAVTVEVVVIVRVVVGICRKLVQNLGALSGYRLNKLWMFERAQKVGVGLLLGTGSANATKIGASKRASIRRLEAIIATKMLLGES